MNDTSLITFKAISTFVNELVEAFGDEHRPLKLYAHLLNKTTLSHTKAIKKHIDAFTGFCVDNRDCIVGKRPEWTVPKIEYNQRVYIDMLNIFQLIGKDRDTQKVVWTHILTISALVDPTGQAKQILKEQAASSNKGEEAEFLTDIITKVESSVDPNANPMEAVNSIMQSGVFSELVTGMGSGLQDGSLDLNKLMGTVQSMVTKLNDQVPEGQGGDQTVDMINTMMGSINAGAGAPGGDGAPQVPDISAMLGPMMGAMMGGQGQGGMPDMAGMLGAQQPQSSTDARSTIEQQIDAQVAAAKVSGKLKVEEVTDSVPNDKSV